MGPRLQVPSIGLVLWGLFCTLAVASEMPDAELNGVTGNIESVDAPFDNAYKVRHIVDPGQGGNRTSVTLSGEPGANPRIAVDAAGDGWVVWWSDTGSDKIYYRHHDLSGSSWTLQKAISTPTEQSRYPEIIHDGTAAWIAYQVDYGTQTGIAVLNIIDSADPVNARTLAAVSPALGDIDLRIHSESGALWMTWVDDSDDVGWVEYDGGSGTWSTTYYECYAGSDVDTARQQIRDIVLGL